MKHLNKFLIVGIFVALILLTLLIIFQQKEKNQTHFMFQYEIANQEYTLYYESDKLNIYFYGIRNLEILVDNEYQSLKVLLEENEDYMNELMMHMEKIDFWNVKEVELGNASDEFCDFYQYVTHEKENKGIRLYVCRTKDKNTILIGDLSLNGDTFPPTFKITGEVVKIEGGKAEVKLSQKIENIKKVYIDDFSYKIGDILLLKYQTYKGYMDIVDVVCYDIHNLIVKLDLEVKVDGKEKDFIAIKEGYNIDDFLEYYDHKCDCIRTTLKKNQNVSLTIPGNYTFLSVEAPYTGTTINYKKYGNKITFQSCSGDAYYIVRMKHQTGAIISIII